MLWWMAMLAAVAMGCVLGVTATLCLGYDPVFRTALKLAKCRRAHLHFKRCVRLEHASQWRALAALSRSIASRPLTLDEWTQLKVILADPVARAMATQKLQHSSQVDLALLDALAGTTKLLLASCEVTHLMNCLCRPDNMQRLEHAIQGIDLHGETPKSAFTELAEAYAALGKTPRVIMQSISAIVRAHVTMPLDLVVQVTSCLFSPSVYLSVSTLQAWLHPRHNLCQLMLQHSNAVDDTEAERLHGVAEAGSLAFASAPSHTTTSVDVSWLNLVLGRWFDEYGTHSELLATLAWKLERMVQAKAVDVKVIDSVSITNLVLGSHPPRVSDLALHPTLQPHELCASANIEYDGHGTIDVQTRVTLSSLVHHQTTLSLRLHVGGFKCRVRLFVPEPSRDPGFGWVAFDRTPTFHLSVTSCPPQVEPLPQLGALLSAELEEALAAHMVLPVWARVSLPWDMNFPLDVVMSSNRRSNKSNGAPNLAAAAGGFMGEVVGGAMGGRLGGHVARGVGEAVGEHLAKYATELIVPIVRDAIASAKHMTHRGDTTVVSSQSVDDLVHLAKHSKHHIDGAVEGVPSPQVDATKGVVNSCLPAESAAKDAAVVSPKTSGVDVALLVSLAKAKKSN
ncbi:hypothetical protein H310_05626 [Aphanomyces invadans]|uniref:SMP-LTD domain-containing protein n=1 Tax=Aphanomyces invadans TaxID=157072 RepID=A0A024UC53_9STRA|nr:hypothetical protein H310_05626 [Aphanomyces invadans]ETW03223.1 hypothetical protein H310_05626 [Aphanomyces invadans]|eukprot:XP_008868607.1 hypothetical protein H310_05626 [Aphanomyces invadans]